MEFDFDLLSGQERLALLLRQIYEKAGFRPYRMGRFEEYGLYQENRRFLTSGQVLTFTDLDGRLLALKPDVTLSIAKNAAVEPGKCGRYYYHENVYRPSRSGGTFREIRQMGVECIGAVDGAAAAETAALAVRTLDAAGRIFGTETKEARETKGQETEARETEARETEARETKGRETGGRETEPRETEAGAAEAGVTETRTPEKAARFRGAAGRPWTLEAGHMGYAAGLFDAVGVPERLRRRLLSLIRDKNAHELRRCTAAAGLSPDAVNALAELFDLNGPWRDTLARAEKAVRNEGMAAAAAELRTLCDALEGETAGELRLDLSLVNDMEYYNGIVMQGFLAGLPRPVLRGGQYDPLAARFRPGARAIGFALYLDELERGETDGGSPMVSVALPKGRLGDKVYNLLAGAGYGCPEDYHDSRKLVVENPAAGIRYFLVKPSDVAIYVEHGAADVGIVGKDIIEESNPDVYELLDTGLGKCRVCVAGPDGFADDTERVLRVATKFVNIAKRHFASKGREIDIIKLNGSIELAPLLGLSDVIVDIVETGTTLKENHLHVIEEFMPVSARFIANRSSLQFKRTAIETLVEKLRQAVTAPSAPPA